MRNSFRSQSIAARHAELALREYFASPAYSEEVARQFTEFNAGARGRALDLAARRAAADLLAYQLAHPEPFTYAHAGVIAGATVAA